MKITESNLKRVISEEIRSAIGTNTTTPNKEEILEALEVLAEASSADLKAEVAILEELLKRAKKS